MLKVKTLKILVFIIASLMMFTACTPQRAFKHNNYKRALRLSAKKIKKGKASSTHYDIASISSAYLVDNVLQENADRLHSESVNDWLKVQNKYYKVLASVGKTNHELGGFLTPSYDVLCDAKMNLDFKIMDHFYALAVDHLDDSRRKLNKESARIAYHNLQKCIEHGGENEYSDMAQLQVEAIDRGTVYFIARGFNPDETFWFKYWDDYQDEAIDCILDYDLSGIWFCESSHTSYDTQTKEIQTGTHSHTDTSGVTINTPIYETVCATIATTRVTIEASATLSRYVINESGQCPLANDELRFSDSDSYEEIQISGDIRALDFVPSECSGEPGFLRSNLESRLSWMISDRFY